jgi:hypothetical protein
MYVLALIKGAKQGSVAAQKCLFDIFADKMMMVCRSYVNRTEDAEENSSKVLLME